MTDGPSIKKIFDHIKKPAMLRFQVLFVVNSNNSHRYRKMTFALNLTRDNHRFLNFRGNLPSFNGFYNFRL